ncbi:unnamed protein product [Triticum turgidum subsp. durum]|uniref:aldehyde oxygenase (deformylating) n=1 Tax=Triticum turgidum subsp. durum TaxID=4567 RepID=A0A9R0Z6J7_TRITD|nr:unnamed protein product [Triticum turgidum subsp. durum]
MAFAVSDELLGTFVPIAVYWLYSGLYIVMDRMEIDDYRLHPKGEEEVKNVVSKWTVVKGVLVQQGFQIAVSLLLFTGLILDTIGGALSFLVAGMTPRTSIFFFSFATIKTVDDHCGLWLPGNILHMLFSNNSAYHDIHHQLYGNKYNFSQPFFVMWDKILGTYMPYTLEERKGGGLEARPVNLGLAAQNKASCWNAVVYQGESSSGQKFTSSASSGPKKRKGPLVPDQTSKRMDRGRIPVRWLMHQAVSRPFEFIFSDMPPFEKLVNALARPIEHPVEDPCVLPLQL